MLATSETYQVASTPLSSPSLSASHPLPSSLLSLNSPSPSPSSPPPNSPTPSFPIYASLPSSQFITVVTSLQLLPPQLVDKIVVAASGFFSNVLVTRRVRL
eukprot:757439-Hanusia_phi.AAC.2